MPKIDFYILNEADLGSRISFACRLIEKAYKNRHRIFIQTENQQAAHHLDEMLWTYRDDSFLPHNLYGEGPEPAPAIQIGYNVTPEKHRDILINLSNDIPVFFKQFNRVLELISNDPHIQASGRERFRSYRAQGLEISTHKLSANSTNE